MTMLLLLCSPKKAPDKLCVLAVFVNVYERVCLLVQRLVSKIASRHVASSLASRCGHR